MAKNKPSSKMKFYLLISVIAVCIVFGAWYMLFGKGPCTVVCTTSCVSLSESQHTSCALLGCHSSCYSDYARCEMQADGKCGWTQLQNFQFCLTADVACKRIMIESFTSRSLTLRSAGLGDMNLSSDIDVFIDNQKVSCQWKDDRKVLPSQESATCILEHECLPGQKLKAQSPGGFDVADC